MKTKNKNKNNLVPNVHKVKVVRIIPCIEPEEEKFQIRKSHIINGSKHYDNFREDITHSEIATPKAEVTEYFKELLNDLTNRLQYVRGIHLPKPAMYPPLSEEEMKSYNIPPDKVKEIQEYYNKMFRKNIFIKKGDIIAPENKELNFSELGEMFDVKKEIIKRIILNDII
jgi:hypothetical protein